MDNRKLKRQLRNLKRLRIAVITGDNTEYTEQQLNDAIERVRVEMGTAEDRKIGNEYDLREWQYLEIFGVTHEELEKRIAEGETVGGIAFELKVSCDTIRRIMKMKGEKEMAKITIEQYKEMAAKGMSVKEMVAKTGSTESTINTYKSKWKKAGLLEDLVVPAKKVTNDSDTKIAELVVKVEGLLEEKRILTLANEEKDSEYAQLNDVYKDLQIDSDDKIAELTNTIAKVTAVLELTKSRYQDTQHIAASYENHENEILEQNEQLREENTYLKAQLERNTQNTDYEDLKQRYDLLAKVATPLVSEFVKII